MTKECPKCKAQMIQRYENIVYCTYPPQHPWNWWCGCGHTETGGVERGITEEESYLREWRGKNPSRTAEGKDSTMVRFSAPGCAWTGHPELLREFGEDAY